jgi:hypothetical protein
MLYIVEDYKTGNSTRVRIPGPANGASCEDAALRGARKLGLAKGRNLWAHRGYEHLRVSPEGIWSVYRSLKGDGSTLVCEVFVRRAG